MLFKNKNNVAKLKKSKSQAFLRGCQYFKIIYLSIFHA
jgi:hypothetical protein